MPKFEVLGHDRETGSGIRVSIDASDASAAEARMRSFGVDVASVRRVSASAASGDTHAGPLGAADEHAASTGGAPVRMRFRATGKNQDTGSQASCEIDAYTKIDALHEARALGLTEVRVELIATSTSDTKAGVRGRDESDAASVLPKHSKASKPGRLTYAIVLGGVSLLLVGAVIAVSGYLSFSNPPARPYAVDSTNNASGNAARLDPVAVQPVERPAQLPPRPVDPDATRNIPSASSNSAYETRREATRIYIIKYMEAVNTYTQRAKGGDIYSIARAMESLSNAVSQIPTANVDAEMVEIGNETIGLAERTADVSRDHTAALRSGNQQLAGEVFVRWLTLMASAGEFSARREKVMLKVIARYGW